LRSWALVAVLACLVVAPVARADGDPASDYLLTRPAFVPPDAGISKADAGQLNATLAAAKSRGYEIRVAVIATKYDMGSVDVLYRQPLRYARFLGQELVFVYHGRLLVAMPNGFALTSGGKPVPASQAVLDRLPPPGSSGHSLTIGATIAVAKLAAASGVVVAAPKSAAVASSKSSRLLLIGIVALVVLVLLGAAAAILRRRRRAAAATSTI
jgi:hypothetical protein